MTADVTVRAAAPRNSTPTLLLYAGADRLVNPRGSQEFAFAAPPSVVTTRHYDTLYHKIFNELDRVQPVAAMLEWLRFRA